MHLANCPACGRAVTMLRDGELCVHGPGPHEEFICPGSGDPALISAAQHLHVEESAERPERLARSVPQRRTEKGE
jgi:hypothetical protein